MLPTGVHQRSGDTEVALPQSSSDRLLFHLIIVIAISHSNVAIHIPTRLRMHQFWHNSLQLIPTTRPCNIRTPVIVISIVVIPSTLFHDSSAGETWLRELFARKYVAILSKMVLSILAAFGLELNMPFCCVLLGYSYDICIRRPRFPGTSVMKWGWILVGFFAMSV